MLSTTNKWGEFKFSAYPLSTHNEPSSSNLYVIQIDHMAPVRIVLLNSISHYDLTGRQTQICVNIGLGKPYSEITESLGIMESTLISHKKEIFRKMEVATRHDLRNKILSP